MEQTLPQQIPDPLSLTHEQSAPNVQATTKNRSRFSFFNKVVNKWTLGILAIVLVLIVGSAFFLWPKAQTVKFASQTRESISNLFTQMDSVNSSLNSLYKYATQDEDDVKLTRLINTFGEFNNVLSTITRIDLTKKENPNNRLGARLTNFLANLKDLFKDFEISDEGKVSFGEKIKGFTTPADDPNKIYRDQRDLAVKVITSIETSEESLDKLESNLGKRAPGSLSSLREELSNLKTKSKQYLSEAQKTADYYVLTSELAIELEGNFDSFTLALESAGDINSLVSSFDDISKELKELKKGLESVGNNDLPMKIEDLHKDTLQLFDVSINFFDKMKVLTLGGDEKGMEELLIQTSVKLNQLIISGSDHEISFWKNNRVLNSYEDISNEHTQVLKKLEQERDKNSFFLLKFLGIK